MNYQNNSQTPNYVNLMESILFFYNEPVSFEKLSTILELKIEKVESIANDLVQHYADRGIKVLVNKNEAQMISTINNDEVLNKLDQTRENQILTPASLETLAVVLYLESTDENTIDSIRGVRSGRTIKKLLRRGYLQKEGGANYHLSSEALKQLGVGKLSDIPNSSEIKLKLKALANSND